MELVGRTLWGHLFGFFKITFFDALILLAFLIPLGIVCISSVYNSSIHTHTHIYNTFFPSQEPVNGMYQFSHRAHVPWPGNCT